jgi:hypothetical protein
MDMVHKKTAVVGWRDRILRHFGFWAVHLALFPIIDSRYDSNIFESGITQSNTQTHGGTKHLT